MSINLKKIIKGMTLEQKAAQVLQLSYAHMSEEDAEMWAKRGVGSFLHVPGEKAAHLQNIAKNSSAKIPLIFGIDAVHGHCLNRKSTIFPSPLSMACTFDAPLVRGIARDTAEEVTADGLHWVFSPVLCLGRDIRWGRVGETFGEDAFLAGELGAAMAEGYRGGEGDRATSVMACAKHYIGYGEATGGRDSYDSELTYRKIEDTLLYPFQRAVEAGCPTVMTAYGSIDGLPCTLDQHLLQDILRKKLGFNGFVVTDWENVKHVVDRQRVLADYFDSVCAALESGNDMLMAVPEAYDLILEAVRTGKLQESVLDTAVWRILRVKMEYGVFDSPERGDEVIGCEAHHERAKICARESTVLLKNDRLLPLQKGCRLAVFGSHADDIRANYGDWTYFSHPIPNYGTSPERPFVTLLEGLKQFYNVAYFGTEYCEKAADCDAIVFAFGDTADMFGEWHDIAACSLPTDQAQLFAALRTAGKPIISVMISSKPMCVPEVVRDSSAVLTNFNGGMYGGLALAETICGALNPMGKLPISVPYHTGQQPSYYAQLPGWHGSGYRDIPERPLFAFGFGLSYTKYIYSGIAFQDRTLTLSFFVENAGDIDGTEIVQVYFRDLVSSRMTPVKRLVRFARVPLKAGEKQKIVFSFVPEDFSFVDSSGRRIAEAGEFELMVGGSSDDADLEKIRFALGKDYLF